MKKIFILLMFSALFCCLSAQAQTGNKHEKVKIQTTIYCSHCKECPTCGKSINEKLLAIKGVKMCEIDEKDMTFTIYFNGQKTNADAIRHAIAALGYDADGIKANPIAYEKLDDCCKKP